MEETSRNSNRGEFYTPASVAELLFNITNKYIPNFNTTHTVWDNCWGTGNLTKDYQFKDLFCSTIQKMDIRRNKDRNADAVKFQYDFLNSDVEQLISLQAMWGMEHEMPEELLEKLNGNEPFMFYINPPYVATGIYGADTTDTKEGQTDCRMKSIMREGKLQSACDQAYAQFLYKLLLMKQAYKNKNMSIAVICPPLFLTASTYSEFRRVFLSEFRYEGGALFKASEFSGLSDRWAISIQIYTPGETEDKKNFKFDLYENTDKGFIKTGEKNVYNLDGERICMDWAKDELQASEMVPVLNTLSSGCKVSNKKRVYWHENSLGYLYYKGNNIYHNENEVGILGSAFSDGSGYSIIDANFNKTMAVFLARRAYSRYGADWTNDKDEYCIPDVDCEAYKIIEANAMVYALFNGAMHASSIKIEGEDGVSTDLINNFHHITTEETIKAFKYYNVDLTHNGKFENRYFVNKIEWALNTGLILPKGIELLSIYKDLWLKTIPLREEFNSRFPEYQVNNWDAGFYQLKWLIKDNSLDDFRAFNLLYKQYEAELRPLVHECGFLRY